MDADGKLFPALQASKEVAGLAFNKPAEKVIYWSIQRFPNKAASLQERAVYSHAATRLRIQTTSRKSKRRRGCHAWTWHPEVGARSFPGSPVPELVGRHGIRIGSQPGLDLQPFAWREEREW